MTRTPPREVTTLSVTEHTLAPPPASHDGEGGNIT